MRNNQTGYALPMTLAVIIVLSLVCAMAAHQVKRTLNATTELDDRIQNKQNQISAEQTLIYQLLTEPIGPKGINPGQNYLDNIFAPANNKVYATNEGEVSANGTPYSYQDNSLIVRLYDNQSFLPLTSISQSSLSRTLVSLGISQQNHERLYARLRDYIDEDHNYRLGGGERAQYPQDQAPANRPLRETREICAVLSWAETGLCDDFGRLLLNAQIRNTDHLNKNLIANHTLSLILDPGSEDPQTTQSILERLQSPEIRNFSDIGLPELDETEDPFSIASPPGPVFTIITHQPNGKSVQFSQIELTPSNVISPFFVHYKYAIGGPYVQNTLEIRGDQIVASLPQPSSDSRIR